jgi:hypothetical protein
VHHIRPYKIFTLVDAIPSERIVNVPLPSRRGIGGTSLLETFLIVAGMRIVNARRIFEFGTFLGANTLNMALNTPEGAEIFTLDLDDHHSVAAKQSAADAPLTKVHLASQSSLDFAGTSVAGKITTLAGDSTAFDFSDFKGTMDFLFVDGGHDLATVKSDTENALEMAAKKTPSAIMWHDYQNPEYPELTDYLEGLAQEQKIFHVEDTVLCVCFNDPNDEIIHRL